MTVDNGTKQITLRNKNNKDRIVVIHKKVGVLNLQEKKVEKA